MYHQTWPAAEPAVDCESPHCSSDTLLLLKRRRVTCAITHYLPFTQDSGAWLTEKLFGVIIYIALGFYRVGPSSSAQPAEPLYRVPAGALVVLFIIIQLAITRIPILGVGQWGH